MTANEFQALLKSGQIKIEKGRVKGDITPPAPLPIDRPTKKKKAKKPTQNIIKRHFKIIAEQEALIKELAGTYEIMVTPVPKPRMTQADKWKKRPSVVQYFNFKDQVVHKGKLMGLTTIPMRIKYLKFVMPMPKSWSQKNKLEMDGQLHLQRPDIDNLRKALQDALCKEDSHISFIEQESKVWGINGKIILTI